MGLKDLFKDKKKEAFKEKAKEVVATGKLVPGKAEELAAVAREHGQDVADDKTMMRRSIYNKAAGAAKGRGKLTAGEAAELAKIQKFLALRDDQVEKTKWDLGRLRTVTDIRQGKLPVVPGDHPAVRGMQFLPGEIAHYSVQVTVEDRPSASGKPGQQVKWATPYVINSARGHVLPVDGIKELGEGSLLLTNKRLFLRANKTAAVEYSPQTNIFLYGDGLRLERTVGNTILRFKSKSDGTAEIIGELLAAVMR
ncbi:MAG TPA: hypothetical protein VFD95_07055 [Usitatibacter sp.]|jgi:hypothetical protein|nr:hypothetical protein [Usitatibacter sp.]